MLMIKKITLYLFLCIATPLLSQENNNRRMESIRNHLEALSVDNPGLTESFKTDINVNNVPLSGFLMAVSRVHKVNINVSPELQNITIVNNFSDVTVADLLVFLCKEYGLDIDFTGNILSIHKYFPPEKIPEEKQVRVQYNPAEDLISMDLDNDPLGKFSGRSSISPDITCYTAPNWKIRHYGCTSKMLILTRPWKTLPLPIT